MPIEADLLPAIENYLDSRAARFPGTTKSSARHGLSRWRPTRRCSSAATGSGSPAALSSRACGGPSAARDAPPVRGALVHGLRHTYATELANSNVSVYALMKLLGHESMATSLRYVAGAAREPATAAGDIYAGGHDVTPSAVSWLSPPAPDRNGPRFRWQVPPSSPRGNVASGPCAPWP